MALIKTPADYNRTGNNWFTRASNASAYVPIPILNSVLVNAFGWVGTALDTGKWLLRGKLSSAATALGAGTVGVATNTAVSAGGALSPVYWANLGSGVATGKSIGTHLRKGSEVVIGGATGIVGLKPQVLQSYTAGIGSIAGPQQAGPGRFVSQVAASRGEDANAAYARLQSGQPDHIAALQSAQSQGMYR